MARPELGTKRVCPTTGRKFYDLNQDPIVSPYTGEALPRASFEPQVQPRGGSRARAAVVEDEDTPVVPAGPETVSLDEVGAAEEESAGADEAVLVEEETADDTFLEEEEEEEGGDVAALIDGDIEDDEES